MVAYLDAASDRRARRSEATFEDMVEAVRAGTYFAHDNKAYGKWARHKSSRGKGSLTGDALESAVMRIAAQFPDNVIHGAA